MAPIKIHAVGGVLINKDDHRNFNYPAINQASGNKKPAIVATVAVYSVGEINL